MADHFDPSEARDPHGKWVKLAQGLKRLSQEDHSTVVKAIGELPKGGQGNRTSIKGVEIRRHQSGAVNVKIGGESRQYTSHEDAARAVIRHEHGMPSTGSGKPQTESHVPKPVDANTAARRAEETRNARTPNVGSSPGIVEERMAAAQRQLARDRAIRSASGSKSSGLKVPSNFKEQTSNAPAPAVERSSEETKRIGLLNYQWRTAITRSRNARGPTAAQSAQRFADKLEQELKAMGAQYRKGVGWR